MRGYFTYQRTYDWGVPSPVVDLRQRNQRDRKTWLDMDRLADRWLPNPPDNEPLHIPPDRLSAAASNIQGGSRMQECRPYRSVRAHAVMRVATTINTN